MPGAITIRTAGPADDDAIGAIARSLSATLRFDSAAFHGNFPKVLANAMLLVAEESGRVIGYLLGYKHLTFWANGVVWWVEELAVAEEFRGKGAGRKLMGAFEAACFQSGGSLVSLATRRAAAFYRAIGYEEAAVYFRKFPDSRPA
jgi:ribosomal protein S18 acetylase RimI-like enzyme